MGALCSGLISVARLESLRVFVTKSERMRPDLERCEALTAVLKDDTELFRQFMDNEGFRRWMTDTFSG